MCYLIYIFHFPNSTTWGRWVHPLCFPLPPGLFHSLPFPPATSSTSQAHSCLEDHSLMFPDVLKHYPHGCSGFCLLSMVSMWHSFYVLKVSSLGYRGTAVHIQSPDFISQGKKQPEHPPGCSLHAKAYEKVCYSARFCYYSENWRGLEAHFHLSTRLRKGEPVTPGLFPEE